MSLPPSKSKSRLGRGLSSLISVSDLPVEAELNEGPLHIPSPFSAQPLPPQSALSAPAATGPVHAGSAEIQIGAISPNPHQPRKQFDEAGIQSLATSIKTTGLVQPIIVRAIPDSAGTEFRFQLIAGERRLRAAKAAGLQTIPAIVREVDVFAQAQMALIENIQREDLNPMDRALAYRALINQLGLTQAELAGRLGEERSSIANYLRLLELTEPVRELVKTSQLSLGHAKILAGVSDPLQQTDLAEVTVSQGLSVRSLEKLIEGAKPDETTPPSAAKPATPHIRDLEKTIASTLGMRVQVRSGQKGRGKLVIHYGNLDQFDSLLERLGVRPE